MGYFNLKGLLNNALINILGTGENALYTEVGGASASAFNDPIHVGQLPLIQGDFVGSTINTQIWNATASGTAATIGNNLGRCQIVGGTASGGYSLIKSNRPARYRGGQAMTARFTYGWSGTPVASNYNLVGVGMKDINVVGGSGTYTWYNANTATDGYFFGYSGANFGIAHRNSAASTTSVENFTLQTAWNVDKCDGTGPSGFNWTDKSKPVPMMIRYPYLGHGNILFYVQPSNSRLWQLVHVIYYSNSSTTPQLRNPSLNVWAQSYNLAAVTALNGYLTCASVFINGDRAYTGPQFSTDNSKTGTTEQSILSLRNATTYNGNTNQGIIRIRSICLTATGGTSNVRYRFYLNTALTGATYATQIGGTSADAGVTVTAGQSMVSVDTAGTTISGGIVKFNASTTGAGSVFIQNLEPELLIFPGDTLTVTATTANSATSEVSINWTEDV